MPRQEGFSLIEMIVALVILGILAAGTTAFIVRSVEGYRDTARRDQLASTARLAAERISRELRGALPNSVRVSGNCIEFMPLVSGARYQRETGSYPSGEAILALPVSGFSEAASTLDALDLNGDFSQGGFALAVYPLGPGSGNGDPYASGDPGVRFPIQSVSTSGRPAGVSRVTLIGAHQFSRQSAAQRLFVTRDPVSFCVLSNGELRRYHDYGVQASQPAPPAGGDLLAEHLPLRDGGGAVQPFRFTAGSLNRNGLVALDLRFMQNEEWVRIRHDIQLRNVP